MRDLLTDKLAALTDAAASAATGLLDVAATVMLIVSAGVAALPLPIAACTLAVGAAAAAAILHEPER